MCTHITHYRADYLPHLKSRRDYACAQIDIFMIARAAALRDFLVDINYAELMTI